MESGLAWAELACDVSVTSLAAGCLAGRREAGREARDGSVIDDPVDGVEGEEAGGVEDAETAVEPESGHLTPGAGVVVGEIRLLRERRMMRLGRKRKRKKGSVKCEESVQPYIAH